MCCLIKISCVIIGTKWTGVTTCIPYIKYWNQCISTLLFIDSECVPLFCFQKDPEDASLFDTKFTRMPAVDSPCEESLSRSANLVFEVRNRITKSHAHLIATERAHWNWSPIGCFCSWSSPFVASSTPWVISDTANGWPFVQLLITHGQPLIFAVGSVPTAHWWCCSRPWVISFHDWYKTQRYSCCPSFKSHLHFSVSVSSSICLALWQDIDTQVLLQQLSQRRYRIPELCLWV